MSETRILDELTVKRIQLLHPALREETNAIHEEINDRLTGRAIVRFTHTLRTFKEQTDIYAIGRTVKGADASAKLPMGRILTKAPAGLSYHNYGLAVDACLLIDKKGVGKFDVASWDLVTDFDGDHIADFAEVVAVFKQYGWAYGGDWKFGDHDHFEKSFGLSVRELLRRYDNKQVMTDTNYVRLF